METPQGRLGRGTLRRILGRVALFATPVLLAALVAQPANAYPVNDGSLTTTTSSSDVKPGKTITVSGSGFAPGSSVSIDVYSTPVHLATVTANGTGAISASVTVPSNLEAGSHTVKAAGTAPDGSTVVLSLPFTVASSSALPVTGQKLVMLVTVGGVVLVVGVGLVLMSGRRRQGALTSAGRATR